MSKEKEVEEWEYNTTQRGFGIIRFKDKYNAVCSVQDSSSAMENCIWLGVDDANPLVLACDAAKVGVETDAIVGWVPYPIPKEVFLSTRMHLSIKDAKKLRKILKRFIKTGSIQPED